MTTKLELEQRLAELNALYAQARERISALEADLAIAQRRTAPSPRPVPAHFDSYPAYVAACRTHARAARQRVVSYVTEAQWRQTQA